MAAQHRKLHSLEGIVAAFALFFVLALTIGFAQAQPQKVVYLRSAAVMVQDASTGEVVINKNSEAIVPIASITKLMTAMIILDRGLDLEQRIVVSREDVDTVKGTRSRLMPGTTLTRDELLLVALMASENRAAAALGRTYPGGVPAFVKAMNEKAAELGMSDSISDLSCGILSQLAGVVIVLLTIAGYGWVRSHWGLQHALPVSAWIARAPAAAWLLVRSEEH